MVMYSRLVTMALTAATSSENYLNTFKAAPPARPGKGAGAVILNTFNFAATAPRHRALRIHPGAPGPLAPAAVTRSWLRAVPPHMAQMRQLAQ
ncbi:MAG TPA: hypothetical protein VFV41_19140 [Streptosporangiaceae bacterium]|nr:hypothetical protein [Streptosporangiaceae bacterium]